MGIIIGIGVGAAQIVRALHQEIVIKLRIIGPELLIGVSDKKGVSFSRSVPDFCGIGNKPVVVPIGEVDVIVVEPSRKCGSE